MSGGATDTPHVAARADRIAENIYEAASAALEDPEQSATLRKLVDDLANLDKKYLALILDRGPMAHAEAAKELGVEVALVKEIAVDLAEMLVSAFSGGDDD